MSKPTIPLENLKEDEKNEAGCKKEEDEGDRELALGFTQSMARKWLGPNATLVKTIFLSMTINIAMSLTDSCSDLAVAIQLISEGHWGWGLTVIIIDYLQILLHSSTSKAWSQLENPKEKLLLCLILVFAPFSFPLLQLRWMLLYKTKQRGVFDFLHQNARLAELISGTVESPMQFIFLLIMYAYGKVPLPWTSSTIISDSLGNQLNIGALPGMISLFFSGLTLIKNNVDASEAKTSTELMMFVSFSILTCVFRLSGYTVLLITLREFSTLLFLLIAFCSLTIIIRFDEMQRKRISFWTTFMVGLFIPCAISERPHLIQYKKKQDEKDTSESIRSRRILTGKICFWTVPIIMGFVITLLLVLYLHTEYKVDPSLIWGNERSKKSLIFLILICIIPTGIFSFIGSFLMKKEKCSRFLAMVSLILAITSIALSIGSITYVVTRKLIITTI